MTNKIDPGQVTPSLSLNTIDDNQWSLEDNLNKTKIMIIFYNRWNTIKYERII